MTKHTNPLILIPARMASSRLPGKPLADIGGRPMIVHVMERAKAAQIGPVAVACAEDEIYQVVCGAGGRAVMTNPDLPSGTDRIRVAADILDPDKHHDIVVNVQGDLPTMDPDIINRAVRVLVENPKVDIATLVTAIKNENERTDPNVVKAVLSLTDDKTGRALYFTRASAPFGDGKLWHHIGIYAYRRNALDSFCALPPSPLEQQERLEQLRALEAGMRIDAAIIDAEPHGVDTPEDLELARSIIKRELNG